MAKSQTKSATSMAEDNRKRAIGQEDEMRGRLLPDLDEQRGISRDFQRTTGEAYKGMLGGTGAYDPEEYARQQQTNERNIASGGYNPEELARIRGYTASDRQYGGYTADEYNRLTAGYGGMDPNQVGVVRDAYGNLIRTGGLSDTAADAMRRQAAGTTQSIYSTLGQKLARAQGIAGTGGAGGETAQMARQAAQQGAVATTGANAEIGRIRQSGIVAGTGGLANFETGVGAGNRAIGADIAAGRRAASEQAAQTEAGVSRGTLQASQAQQDLRTGVADQKIKAAGGLNELYKSEPGYVTSMVKSILDQQRIGGELTSEQARIMTELAKTPGLFDNIMKGIQVGSGAVAGIATGVGGFGSTGTTKGSGGG